MIVKITPKPQSPEEDGEDPGFAPTFVWCNLEALLFSMA